MEDQKNLKLAAEHSYNPKEKILEQTAVLHLSDNGQELFGRSWNIKDTTP
jgi:hypothetical protein